MCSRFKLLEATSTESVCLPCQGNHVCMYGIFALRRATRFCEWLTCVSACMANRSRACSSPGPLHWRYDKVVIGSRPLSWYMRPKIHAPPWESLPENSVIRAGGRKMSLPGPPIVSERLQPSQCPFQSIIRWTMIAKSK